MENEPVVAPYGSWPSPVGSRMLATGRIGLSDPRYGDALHWLEFRPQEDGRYVVVREDGDVSSDVTPSGFNVRTTVHEYGGASWLLKGATVWFSNFADQRLYRQDPGAAPVPISPEPPSPRALRYADGRLTSDGAWILCVRERHEGGVVTNELAAMSADGTGQPKVLASSRDFYSS